jgi:hypothetical protein
MSWLIASAAISAGTSYLSGRAAQSSGVRNANAASLAEGKAIVAERLNQTVRNSYNTAMMQLQLSANKRKLSQQRADIDVAGDAAMSDAEVGIASTGSIGASTAAVVSDIDQKVAAAKAATDAEFEGVLTQYNNDLQLMVINTDASAPQVRENIYTGPSSSEVFATALMSGVASFASGYASRQMKLGLGSAPSVPSSSGTGLRAGSTYGLNPNTRGYGLRP